MPYFQPVRSMSRADAERQIGRIAWRVTAVGREFPTAQDRLIGAEQAFRANSGVARHERGREGERRGGGLSEEACADRLAGRTIADQDALLVGQIDRNGRPRRARLDGRGGKLMAACCSTCHRRLDMCRCRSTCQRRWANRRCPQRHPPRQGCGLCRCCSSYRRRH